MSEEPAWTASEVRAAMGLSVDQLGDMTVGLELDVGPRRNYPVYGRLELRMVWAVLLLRKLRLPLGDVAVRAVRDYRGPVRAGVGWLTAVPVGESWVCAHLLSGDDVVGQASLAGVGVMVDLAAAAGQADLVIARMGHSPALGPAT